MPVPAALARARRRRHALGRRRPDPAAPRRRPARGGPRLAAAGRRRCDPRRRGRGGMLRRGARAGGRTDALRARRRRRPASLLRRVQARPVHRPGDPPAALVAAAAPAVRVGGARLGDHRAADRGVARGGDPEADGAPLGPGVGLARQGRRAPSAPRRARGRGGRRPGACAARELRPRPGPGDRDGEMRPRGGDRSRRPGRRVPPTRASPGSARSARGRSSASGSSAAASSTRSRPGTWPT